MEPSFEDSGNKFSPNKFLVCVGIPIQSWGL